RVRGLRAGPRRAGWGWFGNFQSVPCGPSPDPQYPIPFEPGELSLRHAMLLLRPPEQRRELRPLPNRIEPRIAQHGGITKEPAANHALKKLERGIDLIQACEMPSQIKEAFGV